MKTLMHVLSVMLLASLSFAQQVYKVPFATSGNIIEITVENASLEVVEGVKVIVTGLPWWIHVTQAERTLEQVKPKKEKVATFTFSVDKTAPVNKEQRVTFLVRTSSGETWTKDISISVAVPEKFELLQNYPNPFNPGTRIDYIVPKGDHVKLVVYDLLGQEVQTLVDDFEDAGYKTVNFTPSNLPSGVYFYRLSAGNFVEGKSMLLMR